MSAKRVSRRRFLRTSAQSGVQVAAPLFILGSVRGRMARCRPAAVSCWARSGSAAAPAVGRIGTVESAAELEKALDRSKRVAGACLECAERLLSQGSSEPALALYGALPRRSDLPEALRVLATRLQESSRSL